MTKKRSPKKETTLLDAIAQGERQRVAKQRAQLRAEAKEKERARKQFAKDVKACMPHVRPYLLKAVTKEVRQGSKEIVIGRFWKHDDVPVELMRHFGSVLASAICNVDGFRATYYREHDHEMGDVSYIKVTWTTG